MTSPAGVWVADQSESEVERGLVTGVQADLGLWVPVSLRKDKLLPGVSGSRFPIWKWE